MLLIVAKSMGSKSIQVDTRSIVISDNHGDIPPRWKIIITISCAINYYWMITSWLLWLWMLGLYDCTGPQRLEALHFLWDLCAALKFLERNSAYIVIKVENLSILFSTWVLITGRLDSQKANFGMCRWRIFDYFDCIYRKCR